MPMFQHFQAKRCCVEHVDFPQDRIRRDISDYFCFIFGLNREIPPVAAAKLFRSE
jgi:hypothetical protein